MCHHVSFLTANKIHLNLPAAHFINWRDLPNPKIRAIISFTRSVHQPYTIRGDISIRIPETIFLISDDELMKYSCPWVRQRLTIVMLAVCHISTYNRQLMRLYVILNFSHMYIIRLTISEMHRFLVTLFGKQNSYLKHMLGV